MRTAKALAQEVWMHFCAGVELINRANGSIAFDFECVEGIF